MWYPAVGPLAEVFVPVAQLMQRYNYCVQFIEKQPGRYLDIYAINGIEQYDQLWSEAETSCLDESMYVPDGSSD